jgi:putative transposase
LTNRLTASGFTPRAAVEPFASAYNRSEIEVSEATRAIYRTVQANTLRKWFGKAQRGGLNELRDRRGEHRRGTGLINRTPKIQLSIEGMIGINPTVRNNSVRRLLTARNLLVSKSTLNVWVGKYRETHKAPLAFMAHPDEARGRFRTSWGISAHEIVRPGQMYMTDCSPSDSDTNQRRYYLAIGEDIYSRRLRVLVTKTPQTVASPSLLRRMILEFGAVPEIIRHDNGSEFTSQWFRGALLDLHIEDRCRLPGHPWEGGHIEAAVKAIQHGAMEMLSEFLGHSVAEQQMIRSRERATQRALLNKAINELVAVGGKQSPEQLQRFLNSYCEHVYGNSPHAGLDGKTPNQVWNEYRGVPLRKISNERRLDILFAEVPKGGVRTIGKEGVRVGTFHYAACGLAAREGQRVFGRHDPDDVGCV